MRLIILFLFFISLNSYANQWNESEITVREIDYQRGGQLCIFVFFKEGFPIKHDKEKSKKCIKPTSNTITASIKVPNTPFAIKILHDEDMSDSVTKDWTGFIPAEGLGFSNGASIGFFGPPGFEDAKITFDINNTISIEMLYPGEDDEGPV